MKESSKQKNSGSIKAPVIAIMGHVDHGKSTLLDYIRETNVAEKEAGGITQHMSAYEVEHESSEGKKNKITFLDTPGHEAFSAIRIRGAKVADIAVLVVSAEDGVKPQTLEALKFIKEDGLPYIIAINKIDKPGADIERTKQNLAENEIYVEGYGGSISFVPISAKTGEGIEDLLDMMLLIAEMEELRGDESKKAEGFVLESNLDPKKGISATLIINDGTLKTGMFVASGQSIAPVRIMENFKGESMKEASFSSPVSIIGWDQVPEPGKIFQSFDNKNEALDFVQKNKESGVQVEEVRAINESGDKAVVPIIIKADTTSSIEAIKHEIDKIDNDRIETKIIHSGVGSVSENDIKTAGGSEGSIIIGFHVKADAAAKNLSERLGVEIKTFNIIYKLTDWIKEVMKERTPKISTEEVTGKAKIMRTFSKTKDKQVVGGKVIEGSLSVSEMVRIIRREEIIGDGKVLDLQSQKVKTKEVKEGGEFGAMIESKIDISEGDKVEAFKIVEK